MAKGIEDTTFYRWHRLIALDEVGGDPRSLDAPDAERLHAWAREQAERFPLGLTTLSTHDTKRSEDVRARLLARRRGYRRLGRRAGRPCGSTRPSTTSTSRPPTCSSRRCSAPGRSSTTGSSPTWRRRRNESKQFTSWNDPDERYEVRVSDFAARCLDGDVAQTFARVLEANEATIRAVDARARSCSS